MAGSAGLDEAWVKRLVEADLRGRRFVDVRFRAFVFVTEEDVTKALGPGPHTVDARERAVVVLRETPSTASWLPGSPTPAPAPRYAPPAPREQATSPLSASCPRGRRDDRSPLISYRPICCRKSRAPAVKVAQALTRSTRKPCA